MLGALLLSGSAYADLTTGLAAHYSFDDCSATDSSGNNNNGTITGNLPCTNGTIGKGLLFDGKSYITVPDSSSLNPTTQWTIAFWVRVDGFTNDWSAIVHKGGIASDCAANRKYSVFLARGTPSIVQVSAGDNGCQDDISSKKIAKGKWLHYVGVIDRVNHVQKIYVNGQLNSSEANNYESFDNNNSDLLIGFSKEGYSWESPFKGALDDMRFYNRVLSDDEIKGLYSMSQPVSGGVKGVQQYSVTCKNIDTGQIKTIPLRDGTAMWNCKAAGLKTSAGDNVNISIDAVSW